MSGKVRKLCILTGHIPSDLVANVNCSCFIRIPHCALWPKKKVPILLSKARSLPRLKYITESKEDRIGGRIEMQPTRNVSLHFVLPGRSQVCRGWSTVVLGHRGAYDSRQTFTHALLEQTAKDTRKP